MAHGLRNSLLGTDKNGSESRKGEEKRISLFLSILLSDLFSSVPEAVYEVRGPFLQCPMYFAYSCELGPTYSSLDDRPARRGKPVNFVAFRLEAQQKAM